MVTSAADEQLAYADALHVIWVTSRVCTQLKETSKRGPKDWREIIREESRAYDMVRKHCTFAGRGGKSGSTEVEDEKYKWQPKE